MELFASVVADEARKSLRLVSKRLDSDLSEPSEMLRLDAHGEHDFARAAGYVPDSANNATSTCRCSDYCPCRRATVRVAAVAALAGLDYLCGSPRLGSNDRLVQRKEIAERSLLPMGPIPSCTDLFFINENH